MAISRPSPTLRPADFQAWLNDDVASHQRPSVSIMRLRVPGEMRGSSTNAVWSPAIDSCPTTSVPDPKSAGAAAAVSPVAQSAEPARGLAAAAGALNETATIAAQLNPASRRQPREPICR